MRRVMSFLSGLTVGGLVGATLALLLAPASGDDLKEELRGRVERVKAEMKSAADDRRAELEAQLESLRAPKPPAEETL